MSDVLTAAMLVGVLVATLAICWLLNYIIPSSPPAHESDIETIRASQRECLERTPAHRFSLVQAQGGYMIQCEPIK